MAVSSDHDWYVPSSVLEYSTLRWLGMYPGEFRRRLKSKDYISNQYDYESTRLVTIYTHIAKLLPYIDHEKPWPNYAIPWVDVYRPEKFYCSLCYKHIWNIHKHKPPHACSYFSQLLWFPKHHWCFKRLTNCFVCGNAIVFEEYGRYAQSHCKLPERFVL